MTPGPATTMATDPLAELRGLHLPEAVGAWPPAPGWWVAGLVVAALLAGAARWWHHRRASLAARALRELAEIQVRRDADIAWVATSLAELLRRVALERFGASRVAKLSGERWQGFLRETWPRARRRADYDETAGEILSLAPYAPPARWRGDERIGRERLIAAARTWIRGNA